MAKSTKVKVSKDGSDSFIIVVTTEHGAYTGKGVTALDALKAVPTPELMTASTVTISHAGASKDMFFPSMQLKRLLNPYNMDVMVTDLALGL